MPSHANPVAVWKLLPMVILLAAIGCAHQKAVVHTTPPASGGSGASNSAAAAPMTQEKIRMDCIEGRRLICGRVLKVLSDGLVVDSGYTDLLRPPLTQSWVVPGTVLVSRPLNTLELQQAGTPCIGLVFLTDIPKRPKVKNFDYVIIMGYPAGQSVYSPAPNVGKMIRKFSAGLETAVRLTVQDHAEGSRTNTPVAK